MNKEDVRLIGEILLVILAILFTIYRELKEKGKITKLKKKLQKKNRLEKAKLEERNHELVIEIEKLKKQLGQLSTDYEAILQYSN